MESVIITGLGFVTSIGHDRATVTEALRELRSGIVPWDPLPGVSLPIKTAGTLKGFDLTSTDPAGWSYPNGWSIERQTARSLPPHGACAVFAVRQALAAAGLSPADITDGRTGLACSSAGSPQVMFDRLTAMQRTGWQRGHPLGVLASVTGTLNFNLAAHLGVRGANCGFASACASSAHALGYACDAIRLGRQDRMIVVGAEDLNVATLLPFHAMGALSTEADPARASCPFDAGRNGFAGTGGAVVLILESASAAARREAPRLARLAGWGEAADGFSVAAPHPEGDGLARAMSLALTDAGVNPGQIDWVNAHATSTPAGDRAEALALHRVFGAHRPAVSSTKALTGHGLSMAGAMEAAFSVLGLQEGFIPGQANLVTLLPEGCGLDIPRASRETRPSIVASNASGFGGANVCLILTHA
jgi:3-oxoacyl-[acyl-carrier-protein] synthase I